MVLDDNARRWRRGRSDPLPAGLLAADELDSLRAPPGLDRRPQSVYARELFLTLRRIRPAFEFDAKIQFKEPLLDFPVPILITWPNGEVLAVEVDRREHHLKEHWHFNFDRKRDLQFYAAKCDVVRVDENDVRDGALDVALSIYSAWMERTGTPGDAFEIVKRYLDAHPGK